MTCPVAHTHALPPGTGLSVVDDGVADRFQRVAGSLLLGLFAPGLYDQAMLPAVSAALEDTGRIRNTPWQRAMRTAASDQIMFAGDAADARAEAERLVRLHHDVKGVGGNGIRYSALHPESWNWILISTFFVHRSAFAAITGQRLTAADNQAIWDRFRQLTADLQLPGRSVLIDDYEDLCAYYDRIVAEKLQVTPTLECAVAHTLRPARPDFLPALTAPVWAVLGPLVGHVVAVLGFGSMHPGVRALVPMGWTRRHGLEFAALTFLLRVAYGWLPHGLTDTPLTRNRRKYDRIMAQYKRIGLTSFAPERSGAV
jgi:uncharacterized protein (DUF2236 family)